MFENNKILPTDDIQVIFDNDESISDNKELQTLYFDNLYYSEFFNELDFKQFERDGN